MQVIPAGNGLNLPDSNNTLTLLSYAEFHFYLGRSVIPLLGDLDPSRPKVPAIPWAEFQHRRASIQEQQKWFREGGFAGLGIVTGKISQLVVLDFDSEEVFNDFRVQYRDLTETHTVRSAGRGLPHLYFHLPSHLHISSQKRQGVDLLSDGRYVVALPTCIAGNAYKLVRAGMPKTLTEHDLRRIQAFMDSKKVDSKPEKHEIRPAIMVIAEKTTAADLHNLYKSLTQKGGRNIALFQTSLFARDTGWTRRQAEICLVSLHSQKTTLESHPSETPTQRQKEALCTIKSAFSRPARPTKRKIRHNPLQLPNSVREALMQQGMTYLVRTYEGLLHAGMRPGQRLLAKKAVELLKGLVGWHSVHNALNASWDGQAFFTRSTPPKNLPKDPNGVATETNALINKKNAFVTEQKPELIKRGPKPHYFTMPTIEDFCRILDVKATGSDFLDWDDLATAPKTRMALHRELIKRRPETYTRRWLAGRLGVSRRTIHTYNALIPIHSCPQYLTTALYWSNIERHLPDDEPLQGAFIETLTGKRYPALRGIAAKLIKKGTFVRLQERIGNFYWYGSEKPLIQAVIAIEQRQPQKQPAIEASLAQKQLQVEVLAAIEQCQPQKQEVMGAFAVQKQPPVALVKHKPVSVNPPLPPQPMVEQGRAKEKVKNKPLPLSYFRQPLAEVNQETLANQVYDTLNQIDGKRMSLATARRLTATYSHEEIRHALTLTQKRNAIIAPVGFFITILRSNARIASQFE